MPFRLAVSLVGFFATWWTGIITGSILGFIGLLFPDHKTMQRYIWKSFGIILCAAVLAAIAGALYGKLYLAQHPPHWFYPHDLIDQSAFIVAGSIHNASYIGGFAGLLIAGVYLFSQSRKNRSSYIPGNNQRYRYGQRRH